MQYLVFTFIAGLLLAGCHSSQGKLDCMSEPCCCNDNCHCSEKCICHSH